LEDGFDGCFHLEAEAVDASIVRPIAAGQPHKIEVFTNSFGDLPGRTKFLGVAVEDNFSSILG
jgi:hypothetical protein